MPKTYTVPPAPPHNEGNTVAAWVLTALVVLGAIVVGVGMAMGQSTVIIAGIVGIGLGLILGLVLSLLGFGQKSRKAASK